MDLHTHCFETLNPHLVTLPLEESARQIVTAIKAKGLDGIAITEHWHEDYGFKVKEIVSRLFNDEVLIIPGREINFSIQHVVELYLANNTVFRFVAHPGFPLDLGEDFARIHGIEINNPYNYIDEEKVKALAEKHNLLLLSNSDAHDLKDIGHYYNEIDLEELYSRARP